MKRILKMMMLTLRETQMNRRSQISSQRLQKRKSRVTEKKIARLRKN